MASPNTVILLIVDYHAVIRGQDPRGPLAHASGKTVLQDRKFVSETKTKTDDAKVDMYITPARK